MTGTACITNPAAATTAATATPPSTITAADMATTATSSSCSPAATSVGSAADDTDEATAPQSDGHEGVVSAATAVSTATAATASCSSHTRALASPRLRVELLVQLRHHALPLAEVRERGRQRHRGAVCHGAVRRWLLHPHTRLHNRRPRNRRHVLDLLKMLPALRRLSLCVKRTAE